MKRTRRELLSSSKCQFDCICLPHNIVLREWEKQRERVLLLSRSLVAFVLDFS